MSTWQNNEKKYKQADLALDGNEPQKAERLLRELVEREPAEPLFHWRLGFALSEMHEFDKAIHEYRQALQLDPMNIAALGCLGKAYMDLGKWAEAEKAIRERLALGKSPQHYVFLAHILIETDRFDSAEECCRKAIELDSSFAEAFLNLALVYRHQKRSDEAIDAFKEAILRDNRYSDAFRELGLTYYSVSKLDLAREALVKCLALNSSDAWGHLYLAFCLEKLRDFNGARSHFTAALGKDPENPFFKKKHEEFLSNSHPKRRKISRS